MTRRLFEITAIVVVSGVFATAQAQLAGRLTLINRTLRYLVLFAYSTLESPLHDMQVVGGPDSMDRDGFDVGVAALSVAVLGGHTLTGLRSID